MNWQEQLKAFRDANPDLPEGEDVVEEPVDEEAEMRRRQPRLDVRMERKGRAGKTATLITGWILDHDQLLAVASRLKQRMGVGGSVADGEILIQGDRRDQAVALLTELGFKARRI